MKVSQAVFVIILAVFTGACNTTGSANGPAIGSSGDAGRRSPLAPPLQTSPGSAGTSPAEPSADASKAGAAAGQPSDDKAKKPILPGMVADVATGLIGATELSRPGQGGLSDQEKQKVVLNFDKADLLEVTNMIFGEYLKLNYVLEPTLQGRISMYIEGTFSRDELFGMVARAYEANSISIVPRQGVYYVQPMKKNPSSGLPVAGALTLQEGKGGVKPVIVIYRLRFMDVKQALNNIRPFLAAGAPITSDNATNSLIFVENVENARAVVEVLKALDIDILKEVSMEIVPLKSISPQDAAQSVETVMSKLGVFKDSSIKNSVAFIPLQSFGGVLVLAHMPEILKTARYWLTALDVHSQESGEQINVYFVQNGLANDIADILNQVFGLGGGGGSSLKQQVVQSIRPSSGAGSKSGFGSSTSGFGSSSGSSSLFGSGSSSGASSASSSSSGGGFGSSSFGSRSGSSGSNSSRSRSGSSGGTSLAGGTSGQRHPSGFTGEVILIPDEVNNALVIKANAVDYAKIKKTLESLDIVPRAVLIEVMIAEVSLNKDLQYGLQYFFKNVGTDVAGNHGKLTAGHGSAGTNSTTSATDLASIVNTSGLNLFWTSFNGNISFLLSLLDEKTTVRVLSNPTLLATDNKEASITVGGRQPVPLGSAVSTSSSVVSSIEYTETGIILNVIPHINAGGLVRLEVEQTIRNVDNESVTVGNDTTAPSFTERNIKTTLLAQNNSTVVIGGIIQHQTTESKNGIPWLQDIPIISPLFTNKSDSKKRTELIIAITPHVVAHQETDATREFMEKLRELKSRVERTRS